MTTIVLGMGTNLGDRLANLQAALRLLRESGVAISRASGAWETPPMPEGQPAYLNAVAVAETHLSPHDLLARLKDIERQLGRRPGPRWGPRPIDIDIIFYDDQAISDESLSVPHPGVQDRAFFLAPLAEVVRGPLPILGKSAVELLASADQAGQRRVSALPPP
jgi:2-amino-4-hydroxy-6-hydroxymethyldihydropteridine diphosphokinase